VTEEEVLEAIKCGKSAYGLLMDADPKLKRRFNRISASIVKLLDDVHEHFSDASYFTASGGFHLLLGNSHSHEGHAQRSLEALSGDQVRIGDGDY